MAQEVGAGLGGHQVLLRALPAVRVSRLVYVAFDQLNASHGALATADPRNDRVVLVESRRMVEGRPWHRQRLHFMLSSARHFAQELRNTGWDVDYVKAATTAEGLTGHQAALGGIPIVCAAPNSRRMRAALVDLGVTMIPSDFFLTPEDIFSEWAGRQTRFTMESFYREQRARLDVLMSDAGPVGGKWNFDSDNRLPPPMGHDWGTTLTFTHDDIDVEVLAELPATAWGSITTKTWGTTRTEALAQLDHFLVHHFANFGPYEDAMPADSWAGHHSLLSPYLNLGLLHASEVVDAALRAFESGGIPIASCEGFIRQLIGWREYVNGMYWHLGAGYRDANGLSAGRPLLPVFHDPGATAMACVSHTVADVEAYGWTHHIPRLMVLGNLALLTGVRPLDFLDWMREVFVDAAEWVMVPNVIGMALHADGGRMMTKPYAAGGAYISRMGRFCKGCSYDPKQRTGPNACPMTALYWDFLARHEDQFRANHRMAQQVAGMRRLTDLDEVRAVAARMLSGLERGAI